MDLLTLVMIPGLAGGVALALLLVKLNQSASRSLDYSESRGIGWWRPVNTSNV